MSFIEPDPAGMAEFERDIAARLQAAVETAYDRALARASHKTLAEGRAALAEEARAEGLELPESTIEEYGRYVAEGPPWGRDNGEGEE